MVFRLLYRGMRVFGFDYSRILGNLLPADYYCFLHRDCRVLNRVGIFAQNALETDRDGEHSRSS